MQFQPSPHSFVPPGARQAEYLGDYGKMELKLKERVKGFVGKEARQERQTTREARRDARRSGKKFKKLTQKSKARALWASKYPWGDRPSTAKQAVAYTFVGGMAYEKLSQPIAKGSRPPAMFQNREWRSTILGGLQALQAAGVPGYAELDLTKVKVPLAPSNKYDPKLMALAGKKSLKAAAEAIRAKVIQHKLENVAWNYRALIMIQPAVISAAVRAAGAGVATAIVPMPYGLIPMAIAAQESAHGALLKKETAAFTDKAARGLEKAGVQQSVQLARMQADSMKQEVAAATEVAKQEAEIEGKALGRKLQIATAVSGVLLVGGLVWWVRRGRSV